MSCRFSSLQYLQSKSEEGEEVRWDDAGDDAGDVGDDAEDGGQGVDGGAEGGEDIGGWGCC